ncbi:MAG: PSD1 and planctomycete cytochrome C domain-containing protein [Planctomycetota bacterium]|nr:PSD1 and planctomycete cytochrome C domain-containing protein [Planctomycetota bacterium]MDA1211696.1 PSD1 and planctomycete cytochrome C domain-containing protein [Planctomycetota bacterium]
MKFDAPRNRRSFPMAVLVLCATALPRVSTAADDNANANRPLSYEHDIRPLLKTHCFDCHGEQQELQGELDLRLRRFLVKGGSSGAAIVPGDAEQSLMYQRMKSGEMPPGAKKVPGHELEIIARWIQEGAIAIRDEPESLPLGAVITEEERNYWAFRPIVRPAVPTVTNVDRVRTPIDAFLLSRMEHEGLSFSVDAPAMTLQRRLALDLTGLPLSRDMRDEFLADNSPENYDRLVDRLLSSPHFGERWARHWLDVAGYAESDGYTNQDLMRPYAYKYRDYVIRALNENMPFDRFIHEQLAGDELVGGPYSDLSKDDLQKVIATGFLKTATDGTDASVPDADIARNHVMSETIKIVSSTFLGLSVGCAQCHDHRYDPIPQKDYYRIRAVFEPAYNWKDWKSPQQRRFSLYTDADREQVAVVEAEAQVVVAERTQKSQEFIAAALEEELKKHDEELREPLKTAYQTPADKRTDEQKQLLDKNPSVNINEGNLYQYNQSAADMLKKYDEQIAGIRAKKPVQDFVAVLTEVPGNIPATHLFYRGDHRDPREEIAPGGLSITEDDLTAVEFPADNPELPTSGRRLAFAQWLTNPKNPLVARVLVNRMWMHHFGRPLVNTPGEFGRLGETPSHPALLDWLASEFIASGWDFKHLHRLIVTSTVYRQSSVGRADYQVIDNSNFYYWKKPIQRLDAEIIRDRILSTDDSLRDVLYGPSVAIVENEVGLVNVEHDQRRSIYAQVRRTQPVSILRVFDAPQMETNCERRISTTAAPQSLMLMNSDFVLQHAGQLAEKAYRECVNGSPSSLGVEIPGELASRLERPVSLWQYGYGVFDAASQRLAEFHPLPHWTGDRWQGGTELPDAQIGWVMLRASGGHPGNVEHAGVRRWVAPRDGLLKVTGQLHHSNENGDGVRARLVTQHQGLKGEWISHNQPIDYAVESIPVIAGEAVDFILDCREHETSDSYAWSIQLTLTSDAGNVLAEADSQRDFSGPVTVIDPPLVQQIVTAWELALGRPIAADELQLAVDFAADQLEYLSNLPEPKSRNEQERQVLTNLCQTLFNTNEFLYID